MFEGLIGNFERDSECGIYGMVFKATADFNELFAYILILIMIW